jgi:probable F420-dependent oxidoreductase
MAERPKIGVVFPQTEPVALDPVFARDFGQAAEELGFSHLLAYDHVLGAEHAGRDPRLRGPYTEDTPFREPFVLFAFLAGITSRIEFGTAVLVLPQRQTALVAKQAAEIDLLSGGRLRLAVGLGWNWVEYDSLNEEFGNRGARISEQVEVMRRLWTEPLVDFTGTYHRIDRASILPRPDRSIPIWFGGYTEPAFRRAARVGDGFVFSGDRAHVFDELAGLRASLEQAGRSTDGFGIEAFLEHKSGLEAWSKDLEDYTEAGFTHLSLRTIKNGLTTPQAHLDAIAEFAGAVGLKP